MKSETGKKLIDEVSRETGLSRDVVYKIVMSQFGCIRDTFRSATPDKPETFQSIRLIRLGIFKPRMKVFKSMKGILKYNEEKQRRKLLKYGTSNTGTECQ